MKKILIIPIISLLIPVNGISQVYQKFIRNDKIWSVMSGGFMNEGLICCCGSEYIKFMEDTLIDDQTYRSIFTSPDSLHWHLAGFIRENYGEKRVWLRNKKGEEGLIYNFGMKVGESVDVFNPVEGMYVTYT